MTPYTICDTTKKKIFKIKIPSYFYKAAKRLEHTRYDDDLVVPDCPVSTTLPTLSGLSSVCGVGAVPSISVSPAPRGVELFRPPTKARISAKIAQIYMKLELAQSSSSHLHNALYRNAFTQHAQTLGAIICMIFNTPPCPYNLHITMPLDTCDTYLHPQKDRSQSPYCHPRHSSVSKSAPWSCV